MADLSIPYLRKTTLESYILASAPSQGQIDLGELAQKVLQQVTGVTQSVNIRS